MPVLTTLTIGADAMNPRSAAAATMALASPIAGVPSSHLAQHKRVVEQVMLAMGLEQSQQMATVFDGITRHNPDGLWVGRHAQQHGLKTAVRRRDGGKPMPQGDAARALVRDTDPQRPHGAA